MRFTIMVLPWWQYAWVLFFCSLRGEPPPGWSPRIICFNRSIANPHDKSRGFHSWYRRLFGVPIARTIAVLPDQPLEQASVVVRMAESDQVYTATVSDDQYEVWLPAKPRTGLASRSNAYQRMDEAVPHHLALAACERQSMKGST